IDVDGCTGFFSDAANDRAAFTDHVTDLVRIDLHDGHGWSILRYACTWLVENLIHLSQDMEACLVSLIQSDLHDLFGDALDLDVHLQSSHAIGGTGHFEVHVAEVIFVAEDVCQYGEALAFLDQAHGDTGHRCAKGDTCIHHCQRAAAD